MNELQMDLSAHLEKVDEKRELPHFWLTEKIPSISAYGEIFPTVEERISSRGFLLGRGRGSGAFPRMGQREEIFLLERLRLTYEGPSSSRRRDPSWDHGCSSVPIDFPRHGLEGKSERNSTRKQRRNLTPHLGNRPLREPCRSPASYMELVRTHYANETCF